MLSIGDLARRTRVSVRMLRHYDAYLHAPDGSDEWIVELQCPVRPSSQALRGAQQGP